MVFLLGTVISSVGNMNSHGIAAIASVGHADSAGSDTEHDRAHGHAHEGGSSKWVIGSHGAGADHPHHGADHSHDKAHSLPITWDVAAPQLPVWTGHARLWIEMVEPSRLERPPMG
jgi:hypothetical protein